MSAKVHMVNAGSDSILLRTEHPEGNVTVREVAPGEHFMLILWGSAKTTISEALPIEVRTGSYR